MLRREANDPWILGGKAFSSRLIIGTARFPDLQTMRDAIKASDAEMATIAIRRIDFEKKPKEIFCLFSKN